MEHGAWSFCRDSCLAFMINILDKTKMQQIGKIIILIGLIIVIAGILVYLLEDKLHWFGRLPGDIRVERENFRFYFPITTAILLSIIISLVIYIIRKLFG